MVKLHPRHREGRVRGRGICLMEGWDAPTDIGIRDCSLSLRRIFKERIHLEGK